MDDKSKIKTWLGNGSINIFGRPFSGKDTQAKKLAELLDTVVIGGGDILRKSNIPPHVKKIMDAGDLIPTKDYLNIVLPFFSQTKYDEKPLVLSSVGRWHGEESSVMQALEQSKHPLKAVVLLDINETEVYKRYELAKSLGDRGRRSDDSHGTVENRLKEFREKTLPAIEFYRANQLLIKVDGSLSPEQVFDKIISGLEKLSTN